MSMRMGPCLFIAATMATLGCGSLPTSPEAIGKDEDVHAGSPEEAGAWLFWPVSVRVHPLSKIVRQPGQEAMLDARIEASDATGESTKIVGTVVVALSFPGCEPAMLRWKMEVDSLGEHRAHYDPVTATYRLQVVPGWTNAPAPGTEGTLAVYLYGGDGTVATASEKVVW